MVYRIITQKNETYWVQLILGGKISYNRDQSPPPIQTWPPPSSIVIVPYRPLDPSTYPLTSKTYISKTHVKTWILQDRAHNGPTIHHRQLWPYKEKNWQLHKRLGIEGNIYTTIWIRTCTCYTIPMEAQNQLHHFLSGGRKIQHKI